MKILLFLGTVRQGRRSEPVAHVLTTIANERPELEVELIDPREYNFSLDNEGRQANADFPELTKKVTEADGYIIVAPEYNHGYPGSLKYLLDLHLKEYVHKPVALVGISAGPFGGTRVIEQLVQVTRELGMVVTHTDLHVTDSYAQVTDDGLKDEKSFTGRANKMLDEFIWMAKTLKWGRENVQ